jgi:hypothetical protein
MFPAWHIALTALVTAVLTAAVTAALTAAGMAGWRGRASARRSLLVADVVGVGLATGLGVLLWRLGANVPTLNDDPIPGVSPADVLSAPLAYVAAGMYIQLRAVRAPERFQRLVVASAVAALVALIVNIVTI